MPKDLAALLVEDGAVPADVVERAVARQQEAGGTLDTALLELDALPEDLLASYLARAAELPPAPAAAWKAGDPRARRVFPSRVAERHGLAPFALDGRELSLVATYPVDLGLLDEISFMLSLHLTAHVGPEWRVRELIHRIYGSALAPRLADIAGRVQGAASAPPSAEPAEAEAEGPEPLVRAELVAELAPEPPPAPAAPGERRPPPPTPGFGGFGGDDEPMEPLAAALAEALESVDFSDFEDGGEPAPGLEGGAAGTGEVAPEEEGAAEEPEPEEPRPPPDRTAPPRWTLEDARAAVAASRHRDEVVLAALRYARDFFDFAAMFAVTRDAVAGHDALGIEEARERVRAVAIWADDPGVFKTVIETQSPYLGPAQAGAAGTDAVLHGLGREPRTVLVYPIILRARPVCILYADNGEAPVSARRLGDLLLFLSGIGAAFERIIRDRKKRRRGTSSRRAAAAPPPPAPAADVAEVAPPPGPPPQEEPLPVIDAAPDPAGPPPEAAPGRGPGTLEDAALPPVPDEPAAPAPPPAEEEGELSFASLEAAGEVEPEPAAAPAPPPRRPLPTDPGRTAILWPAAQATPSGAPEGAGEGGEAEPWAVAQEAARTTPQASAAPRGAAESLDALEDRFFSGGDEVGAAPARAPAALAGPGDGVPAEAPPPVVQPAAAAPPAKPAAEAPAAASPDERAPRAKPAEHKGPPPVAAPPDVASLTALADRALDADADAASAACAALGNRRRDPAVRPAADKLRRALLSGLAARAARAARAIGALRDQDAIPLLIQVLETSDADTAKAAADALAAITLQRLGPDARRWLAWWKENRGRGRAEWLFSALTSPDRELRVAASLELSHAAPPPVAYTADMPAPDREKAARAWAGWWSRSGHVL